MANESVYMHKDLKCNAKNLNGTSHTAHTKLCFAQSIELKTFHYKGYTLSIDS